MSVKEIKAMGALKGEVQIPGDKSISHRAVMLGSIARGTTEISHFLNGADCLSTIHCFQKMGIEIEQSKDLVLVHGRGLRGLKAPRGILDTGNSGTTTRLICGILSGQDFSSVLSGDDSLNSRPMKRIMDPLNQMGARITSIQDNNCAPLRIEPGTLHGIRYVSPVASAQVKSSVLLAGLYADSPVSVTEPVLSRNHTELMLGSFGADISSELHADGSATASVSPCAELYGQKIQVPGDISSAAYFIAAGLLVPGSRLLVKNVGINPTRAGFLEVCRKMGADIGYLNRQSQGGEETADLLVTPKPLTGTVIEGAVIPSLIDEIPILAVMAAFAEGTTVIRDAAELKVKETNRIQTVTENLLAMGAEIIPTEDGMIIHGTGALKGTQIQSHLDHRIAMAFSVAALAAEGTTTILDGQCVDVSYPGFFAQLMDLSGK
ncbi:MAG: 3-phosphoshikimate 1-carboxyvinyltransferase [Merdimonas faecis]|uniref:3-phosphoshikimate 1-carboxyvinyltransferase n=1 Tax=Merdimonas faecis TaxID=1653435 RepID=UPI0022E0B26A|nr:3-phosphoshikimate 1-carboxyvinyltransferase [Merdimonas faecis]